MATPNDIARRILVVDDDSIICESIGRVLALDQHQVKIATSGEEALTAFQGDKFDLVILDYAMASMKGDKLAAAIKAQAPQVPIIMITGYGESLRLAGNFPLAVDLVIGKPFEVQDLREAVRRLLLKT